MKINRRHFIGGLIGAAAVGRPARAAGPPELAGEVGITTSSIGRHFAVTPADGRGALIDLPKVMRDELDMRIIDLNTATLDGADAAYLDRFRDATAKAGCVLTNLKMNQRGLDMNAADITVRRRALDAYKRSIDDAARLGCRWSRPLPLPDRPDMNIHIAAYRELAEYAAERSVQMLVENYGWMASDPGAVPMVIQRVGRNIAACPDTGNWASNEVRYAGLAKAFKFAVTCDFKARALGPNGAHAAYDLKRCFEVGWAAGFRGPWCFEHAHADRATLFANLRTLRDMLRGWVREKG